MNHLKEVWTLKCDEISELLKTNKKTGLSESEAQLRLKNDGLNKLPEPEPVSYTILFLSQFTNIFIMVLLGAAIVASLLGKWADALSIGGMVLINSIIGFIQEYRAERAMSALRKLTRLTCRIVRGGTLRLISTDQLVVGDVVLIESGDFVPADGRLFQAFSLLLQEANLTGESLSVSKMTNVIDQNNIAIADRKNMVFMGTLVAQGKGYLIVTATGLKTELGKIATMLKEENTSETPLKKHLESVGHRLIGIYLFIIVLVFFLGLMRHFSFWNILLTSLSLAVAAVPEGLPAIVTITLALSVRRMAKRNSLIRRLAALETLGNVSVICTDKTGTLTLNEMCVKKLWLNGRFIDVTGYGYEPSGNFISNQKTISPNENTELILALKIGALCNNSNIQKINKRWEAVGDPTESALITLAGKAGLEKSSLELENVLTDEIPFDSERKRMSTRRTTEGCETLYVKGAPDVIIGLSSCIHLNGQILQLNNDLTKQILNATAQLASQALRVLAVAYRDLNNQAEEQNLEKDLVFVGLVAMMDPPRPETASAIKTCKDAGIRTVMITGDHKETATAIAKEIGLLEEGMDVIDGIQLDQLSDQDLKNNIQKIAVYARTSAEHKMRIVQAFKANGDIVAMTGDGVNDAPAIKAADVGIAMGLTGSEVTKESSDMVITDDNFASIVHAVEEGRGVFDNITRFISYLFPLNIAELLIVFSGTFLGFIDPDGNPYVSLSPILLLLLNVVTESLPAIALGIEPVSPNVMKRRPRRKNESIIPIALGLKLFLIGVCLTIGAIAACHVGLETSAKLAQTMAFATLVMSDVVRLWVVRYSFNLSLFSNPALILALSGSLSVLISAIYVPSLQIIFGTTALTLSEWLVVFAACASIWLCGIVIQKIFSRWETIYEK